VLRNNNNKKMPDEGFDMFDDDMEESPDATQLPVGEEYEEEESTDNDPEDEYVDDERYAGMKPSERCQAILDNEYFDYSMVEHQQNFYNEVEMTKRGRSNFEKKNASGFIPAAAGDKLMKRSGVERSTLEARSKVTQLVDVAMTALVNRAVVPMVLDNRRTIRASDVHCANTLAGRHLV
jgi:histone H3/H4